jgi:precorrin-6x reductase
MFNNLLSEKEYECYNVVTEAEGGRGVLLIGDFNSATNKEILQMHSIKTVITAAMGLEHL